MSAVIISLRAIKEQKREARIRARFAKAASLVTPEVAKELQMELALTILLRNLEEIK